MTIKAGIKEFLWMVSGAVVLFLILVIVWQFQPVQSPNELLAFKANKVGLVSQMRLTLTSASEAEKSAVMAVTDQESQTFADQARSATAQVEQELNELSKLLKMGGTKEEKDLLDQFSVVFTDFQSIDSNLLDLAVKNTNIKAYSLAFGPAADALKEMNTALSNLVAKNVASSVAGNVALLAFDAQTAALRLQTLLAPHIAEESNGKMDELESQMTREDQKVKKDLEDLAVLQKLSNDPNLKKAVSDYTRFSEIRVSILALSRENTNVLSLAISLGEKRKVLLQCQDILSALQQAIQNEPTEDVNYDLPNPRSLQVEKTGTGK
jgi:hypothetical protein